MVVGSGLEMCCSFLFKDKVLGIEESSVINSEMKMPANKS